MPVTVQIPDTGAYLTADIAGISLPTGILTVDNYIYVIGGINVILKVRKDNFSEFYIVPFANDGKHITPIDMCYAPSVDRIFVLFRNSDNVQITVTSVNPLSTTQAAPTIIGDVVNGADVQVGPGSITTDNASLYVVSFHEDPSAVYKYSLAGAFQAVGEVTGFTQAHCLRYSTSNGGKLFVSGLKPPVEAWVARMTTGVVLEQTATFVGVEGEFAVDKFGVSASHIWVGNRDTAGIIRKYLQSDLTQVTEISTAQASQCTAVDSDGRDIWSLFENGRGVRINPSTNSTGVYTVNQNESFHREITGDGTYIFTAT